MKDFTLDMKLQRIYGLEQCVEGVNPPSFDLECFNCNSDWFSNEFLKSWFIIGRNGNCYSICLFDNFCNNFILFDHVHKRTYLYINIRVQMYTKYLLYKCVQMYMNQKTIQLTDHKSVKENIKVLQELEVIVTEELGGDANPSKIGMYMKLLWECQK